MSDDECAVDARAGADTSHTYPSQAGQLKKGDFVLLKDHPCKIVDISTSKVGKHGHAKANIVGLDIFTQKKYEEVCPTTHNMYVPFVTRTDYQVQDVLDGFVSLLDDAGAEKSDLRVPAGELGEMIEKMFGEGKDLIVSVIKAMGEEHIIAVKEAAEGK